MLLLPGAESGSPSSAPRVMPCPNLTRISQGGSKPPPPETCSAAPGSGSVFGSPYARLLSTDALLFCFAGTAHYGGQPLVDGQLPEAGVLG